jgi:RNA recognition motif-containing protein
MNIYVGNLSYEVAEEDLQKAFECFGQIESVKVIKDNYSGRSKGFGFVEMPNEPEARSAIDGLKAKDLKGRPKAVDMEEMAGEEDEMEAGVSIKHFVKIVGIP